MGFGNCGGDKLASCVVTYNSADTWGYFTNDGTSVVMGIDINSNNTLDANEVFTINGVTFDSTTHKIMQSGTAIGTVKCENYDSACTPAIYYTDQTKFAKYTVTTSGATATITAKSNSTEAIGPSC